MGGAAADGVSCGAVPAAVDDFYHHVNKQWLDDPANAIPGEYSAVGDDMPVCDAP